MVAIARTIRVIGCMAQEILGAPITTCDVEELSLLGPAMGATADALDRLPLELPPPLDSSRFTDQDTEAISRFIEQTERIKNARVGRELMVRALRLAAFVTSVVGYFTELADAWGDLANAHEELECCRGGNVGGRTGCTCAERFPPSDTGKGGNPVWRRVASDPTSYVCEPCPEGSVWDPTAPTPVGELLFRSRERPWGDRGACVLDYEPPEWTACPRIGGDVDWDAVRDRAQGFVDTVGDPRVQLVELAPRGGICPSSTSAQLYVPCGSSGAWPKEFSTARAPEPTAVREGDGLSAYGEQLAAPYGFFVDQAGYCESGATTTDEGRSICAPTFEELFGEGLSPEPVSPEPPSGGGGGSRGACRRVDTWETDRWDWFLQAHESYVAELRETDDRWERMSFYFREQILNVRGAEFWVITDDQGVYRAAALLQKPSETVIIDGEEDDVLLPGFELEALASSARGYGGQLLGCILDDLLARGDLPLTAFPAEGAVDWWAGQAARVNADARPLEAVQPDPESEGWVFREPCDEPRAEPFFAYRGVTTTPDRLIARGGFPSRGADTNLLEHLRSGDATTSTSGWISNTRSADVAAEYAFRTRNRSGRDDVDAFVYRVALDGSRRTCVSPTGNPARTDEGVWADASQWVQDHYATLPDSDELKDTWIREAEVSAWNGVPLERVDCGWRGDGSRWSRATWMLVHGNPATCPERPPLP